MLQQIFSKKGRANKNNDGNKLTDDDREISTIYYDANAENVNIEFSSRLSMNLSEILNNRNCLSYFIQFLETKDALSLIKLYLDVDCFKKTADTELKLTSNNIYNSNHEQINKTTVSEEFDEVNVKSQKKKEKEKEQKLSLLDNEVPDLKILCDLSMRKSLTDDEKSMICNNKNQAHSNKINKRKAINNNNLDNNKNLIIIRSESATNGNVAEKSLKLQRTSLLNDAVGIFKKYLTGTSQYCIDFPPTISSKISLDLCAESDDNILSSNVFREAQSFVFERLESEFLNDFLESLFYYKYQIEIIEKCTLADVLCSGTPLLFYFMEFLEQEKHRNLLEFWLAAHNFRSHYLNASLTDLEEIRNDAMILYEKYFSLQSTNPLKIPDNVRTQIELEICENCQNKIAKCFDLPLKLIYLSLENNFFGDFLKSQLFENYLNELKLKICDYSLTDKNSLRKQQRRSDVNYGSSRDLTTNFISQQNTLLAMDCSKYKNKKPDMQIDSRQLTDPDLLWQRNSKNGLVFGRVNSLGRYERDFDDLDESESRTMKWGGTKFKNAVKKFVSFAEHKKEQEEIAWQLAEIIVNDVTNITLKQTTNDP